VPALAGVGIASPLSAPSARESAQPL